MNDDDDLGDDDKQARPGTALSEISSEKSSLYLVRMTLPRPASAGDFGPSRKVYSPFDNPAIDFSRPPTAGAAPPANLAARVRPQSAIAAISLNSSSRHLRSAATLTPVVPDPHCFSFFLFF
jgi:hypothetical protein